MCSSGCSVWWGEMLHLKLLYQSIIGSWKEKYLEIKKGESYYSSCSFTMLALLHTHLWVVACVYRQCSAQDPPPSDHGMNLLAEWTKAAQVAKPAPVPVVGTGKYSTDESERMSSWLKQINAAEDTVFLSLPQPQMTVKCYKSPTVTICTNKLNLMRSRVGFVPALGVCTHSNDCSQKPRLVLVTQLLLPTGTVKRR